jgi:hypothetical protein
MNAAASPLFWSQFGRHQPDDESSGFFGGYRRGNINGAATFCGKWINKKITMQWPSFKVLRLHFRASKQPENNHCWSQFGWRGLSPTMNAAAATLFWSQFGRPQPDDESSSGHSLLVSIRPASADDESSSKLLLGLIRAASPRRWMQQQPASFGSIPVASYIQRGGQPQNSLFWS